MKLATVERIDNITNIASADKIVLATILGWQVIVKKDEYKIGDLCVYIPIDTQVDPSHDAFKFLAKPDKPTEFIRIRTMKIRGEYSQGLIIPISTLPPSDNYTENQDISTLLPVYKYEKENIILADGTTTHNEKFPTDIISKTDEDNLKTAKKALKEFIDIKSYITLKMDGSSMTIIKQNGKCTVCSRNLILDEGAVMYQYINREKILERIPDNVAIQGEFCGPKINKNQMGLKDYKFYVFNVKDLDTNKYYGYEDIKQFCTDYKLDMVPLVQFITINDETTIQDLQDIANKVVYTFPNNKTVPAEGIVIRPMECIYSKYLNKNLSVKIINQLYKD
jgi:RNA ligase (TIGR02306 family)